MNHAPYPRLLAMIGLSFIAMYVLMYAMVNACANVFHNINQAYMAGLMAAPMGVIELALMRHMYPSRRANIAAVAGSLALLLVCWFGVRTQALVGNRQFLRSMIPHHASALLMCRKAAVDDAGIRDLCRRILASQQAEIDEMKAALERLR